MSEEVQVRKEKNPSIVVTKPYHKTVLLCANGFQTQDVHDATPIKEYFEKNFGEEYPNCEIECVHLFAPADTKTHKKRLFEKALRERIEHYIALDYDILLMGYSFSCALTAKMAAKYKDKIRRVIFVAPVYDTIVNHMIPGYIKYALKYMRLRKKYGDKVSKAIGRQTVEGLPGLLIAIFGSILTNRHYFRHVRQDTLLIRGDEDVLCTEHSLKKVEGKLKGNYEVYHYPKMTHSILKSLKFNGVVYEDVLSFSFNTPYLLENKVESTVLAKAKEASLPPVNADGEEVPTFSEIFDELDPDGEEEEKRQNDF
ncbi:MAG: hypothetical protein PUA93_02135 [Eubacteriales bacterium]|nr:hypothetical protein [Eubacteriales bacterium]